MAIVKKVESKDVMENRNYSRSKSKKLAAVLLPLIFCLLTLLTGCVNYEVGINFNNPQNGNIVQHIQISKQLQKLDRADVKKWLNKIELRSHQMQGKVKKINGDELLVTIPFKNGQELNTKFNQLFHHENFVVADEYAAENLNLQSFDSEISIQQNNFLFLERNALDLTIDLRALGSLANHGKIAIAPENLADLQFQLNTPWLAYPTSLEDSIKPLEKSATKPKQLAWHLQPGEINHIQAVFWLPSPIGLGALVIILLMLAGFYLKYRRLPGTAS